MITTLGPWSYVILFAIIFAETGLIVFPFLPGDSLLFAAGALTGISSLNVNLLFVVLSIAAILGNSVNYGIGYWVGPKVFHFPKSRWFNPESLQKTHHFFQKYGGRSIVLGRFMPIIRTFVPFVAGIGRMHWVRFQFFNIVGSLLWVGSILYLGYFLGNSETVSHEFSLFILGIIVISFIPAVIEFIRQKRKK